MYAYIGSDYSLTESTIQNGSPLNDQDAHDWYHEHPPIFNHFVGFGPRLERLDEPFTTGKLLVGEPLTVGAPGDL